jgi:hypothetical protein
MFCAFSGRPKIVRLHGSGRSILPDMAEWPELRRRFPEYPGVRQIIVVEVTRVSSSCGFGVPLMEYVGQRENLPEWERGKGEERLVDYRAEKNSVSIDGLPAPLSSAAMERRE